MKQVTAILLGAGQRGAEAYASYALDYPNELKFVPSENGGLCSDLYTGSDAL